MQNFNQSAVLLWIRQVIICHRTALRTFFGSLSIGKARSPSFRQALLSLQDPEKNFNNQTNILMPSAVD